MEAQLPIRTFWILHHAPTAVMAAMEVMVISQAMAAEAAMAVRQKEERQKPVTAAMAVPAELGIYKVAKAETVVKVAMAEVE